MNKRMKKFAIASVVTLFSTNVLSVATLQNLHLGNNAGVVRAEEDTPPEDEILPDAEQLKAIKDFTELNNELESLIDSNPEEARYLVEDETEQVSRWKSYLAKTTEGKAQALRWENLVSRLNGGGTLVVTTEDVTETEVVAFETVRENDPNLEEGKEVVATEGRSGVRTIVYTVTKTDGVETGRVVKSDMVTTPAVTKVVKVGTKKAVVPVVITEDVTETEVVAFETVRENDPNLEEGKAVVATEGRSGVRTIVYTVTKTDGVETGRVVKSDMVTTPAVTKVVKVGTKKASVSNVTTEKTESKSKVEDKTVVPLVNKKALPETGYKSSVLTMLGVSFLGGILLSVVKRRRKG